jgi:hypothetical protein
VGEPNYDDPGLAFLFAQLRDWSLQTVRGASLISPKTEFNVKHPTFVIFFLVLRRRPLTGTITVHPSHGASPLQDG